MSSDDTVVNIMPGYGKRAPNAILETAKAADLKEVVVIGWDQNGELFMSSSAEKLREIAWLLWNADDYTRTLIRG